MKPILMQVTDVYGRTSLINLADWHSHRTLLPLYSKTGRAYASYHPATLRRLW